MQVSGVSITVCNKMVENLPYMEKAALSMLSWNTSNEHRMSSKTKQLKWQVRLLPKELRIQERITVNAGFIEIGMQKMQCNTDGCRRKLMELKL